MDSYWELMNGYKLSGINEEDLPGNISINLYNLNTSVENDDYIEIINNWNLYSQYGVLFFMSEDEYGFQPRPFPGYEPFQNSSTGHLIIV